MSRIGLSPITLPAKVELKLDSKNNIVTVKGPKGELEQKIDSEIAVIVDGNTITLTRATEQKRHKAMHGLYRSLISNMIQGVSEGFKTQQEFVGVGYKVTVNGQLIEMSVGYSHDIIFQVPKEITATAVAEKGKAPTLTLESYDKQLLGQIAAKIRAIRKPEPYKGKGIKFVGEQLRRKAGKSSGK